MDIYYKSDFTLIETFLDENGVAIDMTAIDFKIDYYTLSNSKYTVSKTGATYVNCSAGSATNILNVFFQKHGMPSGKLQREITLYITNPDFVPTEKVITNPVSDIVLVAKGGNSTTASSSIVYPAIVVPPTYYDIKDLADSTGLRGTWSGKLDVADLQDATDKDAIADTDIFNYQNSASLFGIVKTTWLNVKAKLKTYFDAIYATINHNHNNVYEPANSNIQSHIGDGDIHVTSSEKSSWSGKQDALTFSTNIETDKASTTKVSAIKTFYDWAVGKFIDLAKIVTTWTATTLNSNVPSEKLVKDSLNLKADILPANGATSALRALYIARSWNRAAGAGAEKYELSYNESTGFYEMYGINDLTEADVAEIYNASIPLSSNTAGASIANFEGVLSYRNCRTNFPLNYFSAYAQCTIRYIAQGNTKIEKFIYVGFFGYMQPSNIASAFNGCVKLNEVSVLDLQYITTTGVVGNAFLGCTALITVLLKNLKVSFSFGSSPLLSLTSLQYLITNRANGTTPITITVHADVWAKLNDAVNYPTWNALLVDAVANQYINFASA